MTGRSNSNKDKNVENCSTLIKSSPIYSRNFTNYLKLPFNSSLKDRARELRKSGNISEVVLWNNLKKKQFKGYDFDRQKIIGNYIVDFYCTNCHVVIEIDGSSHNTKYDYDMERDKYLHSLGLTVIHINAYDVLNRINVVMEMLQNHSAFKDG